MCCYVCEASSVVIRLSDIEVGCYFLFDKKTIQEKKIDIWRKIMSLKKEAMVSGC